MTRIFFYRATFLVQLDEKILDINKTIFNICFVWAVYRFDTTACQHLPLNTDCYEVPTLYSWKWTLHRTVSHGIERFYLISFLNVSLHSFRILILACVRVCDCSLAAIKSLQFVAIVVWSFSYTFCLIVAAEFWSYFFYSLFFCFFIDCTTISWQCVE